MSAPTIQDLKRPKRAAELDSQVRGTPVKKTLLPGVNDSVDEYRESRVEQLDPALILTEAENLLEMEKFMNEPVKIIIHRSHEKNFAPKVTDLVSINGVPAEVLTAKGWIRMGYLPRGVAIVVKRKVVEVIARSRIDSVNTEVERPVGEDPINRTVETISYTLPFQLLEDQNREKGPAWFETLMAQQI